MKSILLTPALLAAALVTTGCGDVSLGDKVQLNLDADTQTAQFSVEMSDGLQINMLDGSFPIAEGYGQLVFTQATQTENARIAVEIDLGALALDQLADVHSVSSLPNGSPLPVAVTGPLVGIPVLKNENFEVDAVLSVIPTFQAGASIGIAQMSSTYIPNGIAICQNFRNAQNVAFSAICLYGPSAGKSGGIFVGANFGDVLNSNRSARSTAMLMSVAQPTLLKVFEPISMSSSIWSSQTHDPAKSLKGSKGQKVLRNAQRILKSR